MSNTETTTSTATSASLQKTPTHSVYHVRDRNGQRGFWTRIGAAWAHTDGKGFNVQVDCVPLDGRITIRIASENKE